jgi:hypothetical protein
MPRPVTKVLDHPDYQECLAALGQNEYETLPGVVGNMPTRPFTSRWTFTDEERARIAAGGDLWLTQLTFGTALQPVILRTEEPSVADCMHIEL